MLVELGRRTKNKAGISCSFQESSTVQHVEPKRTMEVRVLDALNTNKEVSEDIRKARTSRF